LLIAAQSEIGRSAGDEKILFIVCLGIVLGNALNMGYAEEREFWTGYGHRGS
jgi:hypothetical protein